MKSELLFQASFVVIGYVLVKILFPFLGLTHFYGLVGDDSVNNRYIRNFFEDLTIILILFFITNTYFK